MQFLTFALAATTGAILSVLADNTITFLSQDGLDRTITWTHNPGCADIAPTRVHGGTNVTVDIPLGWVGNFFAVADGEPHRPGMLGEVAFQAYAGATFFDVSAIVEPGDKAGVKQLWPAVSEEPVSGCIVFPCDFAYYVWDQHGQTRATHETDLYCSLGTSADVWASAGQNQRRSLSAAGLDDEVEGAAAAAGPGRWTAWSHDFVLGKWPGKEN